jgi:DNA-directed RNA polymerase specialized sigma24 family protein
MSQLQLTTDNFFIGDIAVMDDGRLLVEQAKSDPHAFGQLFDRHYDDIVKSLLHRALKQLQAILDIPQERSGENLKGEAL